MRLIALLLFFLIAFALPASAADYYMTPSGSDSRTGGSLPQAWATLSHAQGQLTAGDTLYIVNGTYYNDAFVAQVNGTLLTPITIKAYNGTPVFMDTGGSVGRSGTALFNFGDNDISLDAKKHIGYYDVGGFRVLNYSKVLDTYWRTNNISFHDIATENCSFTVHLHRRSINIVMKNFTVHNAYYAPFHFWYNNSYCTLSNATITGEIYDHGIVDFHTNNSNMIVKDLSFDGKMAFGEAIYLHGDCAYGENRNNSIYNISLHTHLLKTSTTKECIDVWQPGFNNCLNNLTLKATGGISNLVNLGETCGLSTPPPTNFTLSNCTLIGAGARAINIECGNDVGTLMFRDLTIINTNWTQDISVGYGTYIDKITFRNVRGDNKDWTLYTTSGLCTDNYIDYTDSTVFEITAPASPRYYPGISNYTLTVEDVDTISHYDVRLHPTNSYLHNVTVQHDSTSSDDRTNITIYSSVTPNPTWINATMQKGNTCYNVSVDGAAVGTITSDAAGVVHYQYTAAWGSTSHTFEITSSGGGAESFINPTFVAVGAAAILFAAATGRFAVTAWRNRRRRRN